jgi:hypothetical protein
MKDLAALGIGILSIVLPLDLGKNLIECVKVLRGSTGRKGTKYMRRSEEKDRRPEVVVIIDTGIIISRKFRMN